MSEGSGCREEQPDSRGSPRTEWISVRPRRVLHWCVRSPLTFAFVSVVAVPFVAGPVVLWVEGEQPGIFLVVLGVVFAMTVVMTAGANLWVMPTYFAAQGVEVTPLGLRAAQRPLLWSAGQDLFLPWRAIRGVVVRRYRGRMPRRAALEVHVAPDGSHVSPPGFTVFVPAGDPRRGGPHRYDRLVFTGRPASRVRERIEEVAPERLRDPGPDPAEVAPERRVRWRDAAPGTSDDPPDRCTQGAWIRVRRVDRRKGRWHFTLHFGPLLAALDAVLIGGFLISGEGERIAELWLIHVITAVPLVGIAYLVPRFMTRQGVRVGADGVALVSEGRWWLRGGTVFLPWERIDSAVGHTGFRRPWFSYIPFEHTTVTLFLDGPLPSAGSGGSSGDASAAAPYWAAVRDGSVVVPVDVSGKARLLGAIRTARPGLEVVESPSGEV
ncbi:hypothetical protein HNR23_003446 [Nocardiopsis mwathae]|uniref:Uncharacterized protein n=1 Tax=Nocardiopsis mwathae TaxID=1472723 RepID=A0A7W9YKV1_9ACTN|nr:hypothetical protein [Nocardiopsis mwathae]MBB6173386.1 hypothetical protein [Nocardiopsis mwathae]